MIGVADLAPFLMAPSLNVTQMGNFRAVTHILRSVQILVIVRIARITELSES